MSENTNKGTSVAAKAAAKKRSDKAAVDKAAADKAAASKGSAKKSPGYSAEERKALVKAKCAAGLTPEQAEQVVANQEAWDREQGLD